MRLSLCSKDLLNSLMLLWPTFFRVYLHIEPNFLAADWKEHLKRWYVNWIIAIRSHWIYDKYDRWCSKEQKCIFCFQSKSPVIKPWIHLNLCHGKTMMITYNMWNISYQHELLDHRKHAVKSCLISKTYAKEQFGLNERDLSSLLHIKKGKRSIIAL